MEIKVEKIIQYFCKSIKVACDEKCNKAWGINNRPNIQLSEDVNDIAYLSDNELEEALEDPGTYEGGDAKSINKEHIPNKWCVRECERCWKGNVEEEINLCDFSKRVYNKHDR